MANRINLVGVELEGFFEELPQTEGTFKHDSSVEFENHYSDDCDGSCQDDCECYSYCECDQCLLCTHCENPVDECECESCLTCEGCENHFEDCDCDRNYVKQDDCENEKCKKGTPCDDCVEICDDKFTDQQEFNHMCSQRGNSEFRCDRECGCDCSCDCNCECANVGEFVSRPLKPELVEKWIENSYPTETNSSCGGHVHISLKTCADYMLLMDRSFYKFYLVRIEAWGKLEKLPPSSDFWKRLKGNEHYCQGKFTPERQRDMTDHYDDPRYAIINFCYNVDKRRTVEFRMLPCFEKDSLMISGVRETMAIVNDYLNSKRKAKKIKKRFCY